MDGQAEQFVPFQVAKNPLESYGRKLTSLAKEGKLDPVIGREEELRRVIPVVRAVHRRFPRAVISVDTYKAEVARLAILHGAKIINDITALRGDPQMASVIAKTDAQIILMYAKDPTARTSRAKKRYANVIKTISDFFEERIAFAQAAGIKRSRIILDPGMGAFVSMIPKYTF